MYREHMSRSTDAAVYRATAQHTKAVNVLANPMRGGIRF